MGIRSEAVTGFHSGAVSGSFFGGGGGGGGGGGMNVLEHCGDSFLERKGYSFHGFTEIRSEELCRFILGYSGDSFFGV